MTRNQTPLRERRQGTLGAPVDPDAPRPEHTVAEEVRETWLRGAMDALQAGREIPVRDIPASTGDAGRLSDISTADLFRRAQTRRYIVNVDIRALEARRRLIEAAETLLDALGE